MSKQSIYICIVVSLLTYLTCHSQAKTASSNTRTWTLTYLKSTHADKNKVKKFLEKNWFVMDSIAVTQGLIGKYELIENIVDEPNSVSDWDFIVAVEYFTPDTYSAIAEKFEIIRKNHKTIAVDGMVFNDMAKIVKSETVRKIEYRASKY
jgi:hypothetical protein